MISDELYSAIGKIETYRNYKPELYEPLDKQITLVVAAMDWLRDEIDQKLVEQENTEDADLEELSVPSG